MERGNVCQNYLTLSKRETSARQMVEDLLLVFSGKHNRLLDPKTKQANRTPCGMQQVGLSVVVSCGLSPKWGRSFHPASHVTHSRNSLACLLVFEFRINPSKLGPWTRTYTNNEPFASILGSCVYGTVDE